METSDLINYYVNLLAIQYKTLNNSQLTIQALAAEVVADQIFLQVEEGFALDTAIGAQLDILAGYVGAPREIFGYNPSIPYFALYGYSDSIPTNVGFASYSDTSDPVDNWLSYSTSQTTFVLSDGQLRSLIQYLIAVHGSDHTLKSIDEILQTFFGQYATVADDEDMSIVYTHQSSDPNTLFSIINTLNRLPHPAGVAISVVEV